MKKFLALLLALTMVMGLAACGQSAAPAAPAAPAAEAPAAEAPAAEAPAAEAAEKAPEDYTDVRGLVTADYQELLEKAWVDELRKKYTVVVNKEVLATVNKHDE